MVETNLIHLYSLYRSTVVAPANPEGFIRLNGGVEFILSNVFLLAGSIDKDIDAGCLA